MMFKAADAQRVGLVSLTDLNRALGLQPLNRSQSSPPHAKSLNLGDKRFRNHSLWVN
jgi:hypothetical protein